MVSTRRKIAIMTFTPFLNLNKLLGYVVRGSQRAANTGQPGIKQTGRRASALRDVLTLSSNVMRGILRPVASAVSRTVLPAECVPTMIACPIPTMTYGKHIIEAAIIFAMCSTHPFSRTQLPLERNITSKYEMRMNAW